MCLVVPATGTAAATTTTTTSSTNTTTTTAATTTTTAITTTTTTMKSTMTFIFRDRMSVYYAAGLGRADSDEERELRNVSARRAKERHRLRFPESARRRSPTPLLVSKLRSVTVSKLRSVTVKLRAVRMALVHGRSSERFRSATVRSSKRSLQATPIVDERPRTLPWSFQSCRRRPFRKLQ